MAIGEWLSVQSARELYAHQIAVEREELGIDPEALGGSARVAAGTSFGLFALGAIVPISPFFVATGSRR